MENLSPMQAIYNRANGFTMVEIVIVITVASILTGVVMGTFGGFYRDNVNSLGKTTQDTNTRGVLRSIEKDLSNVSGFITDATVAQPLGSNNGTTWSYLGDNSSHRVLMATTTATDKAYTDDTRLPVFINSGSGCGDPTVSPVAQNGLVYFVAQNSITGKYDLYRRTITNISGGVLCGSIYQKQSCSPAVRRLYPSVCTFTDADILRDIDSFTVDYYTSPTDPNPISNQYNNTTTTKNSVKAAKAIKITVTTKNFIGGKTEDNIASIRISIVN